MMSSEEMQATYMAAVNAWNRDDLDGYYATYAPDVSFAGAAQSLRGLDALRVHYGHVLRAFPGLQIEVRRLVVDPVRRLIAAENVERGTHSGDLLTPGGVIPATGRTLEMQAALFLVLNENGLVCEATEYVDRMQFAEQLL